MGTVVSGAIKVLFVLLLPLWSIQAAASDVTPLMEEVTRPDDDAIIASVQLDRFTLTPGLILYQDYGERNRFWIPLGSFLAALELQVEVDPYAGTAIGWIYEEDREFQLDLKSETLSIGNKNFELSHARGEPGVPDRNGTARGLWRAAWRPRYRLQSRRGICNRPLSPDIH